MIKKKQKKKIERTEAKNKERKGYLGIEIADISCGILISLGGVLAQQIGPNSRSDSSGHAFYSLLLLLLLLAALSLWFLVFIYSFTNYHRPPLDGSWKWSNKGRLTFGGGFFLLFGHDAFIGLLILET